MNSFPPPLPPTAVARGIAAVHESRLAECCRRFGLPPATMSARCTEMILPASAPEDLGADSTLHDLFWSVRGAIRGVVPCVRQASPDRVTYRITFWARCGGEEPAPHQIAAIMDHHNHTGQALKLVLPEELNALPENPKVLLVEDDLEVAELERDILKALNYTVIHAANGLDGLRLAQSEPIVAAVLDADLPGMDGFEVCLRIRANPSTNSLPILFLSGNVNAPLMAIASGADKVLTKPEGITQLAAALAELLNR